jgi:hypothetical protein
MSSIIKVDTIQDQDGNNIINENANTITIGKSGDTVTVAAGASFVGGGIEWQSTIVTTSTLTAVAGKGYWINTTSNACTVTLPASASVGDQIIFVDYARTWNTNNLTINTNSLNYQGNTSPNPIYNTNGQSVSIVYSGATKGWIPTVDDDVTLETPQSYSIDFLVVAGGGAGGFDDGGGGGAGGFRTSTQTLNQGTTITITVGDGGATNTGPNSLANNGSDSSISGSGLTTITSAGGGGGKGYNNNGGSGGSGGGGGAQAPATSGGSGNTPSTSPSQGNNGAGGYPTPSTIAGGGGGANEEGNNDGNGEGGDGTASSITLSSVTYAGGGGGATRGGAPGITGGTGGGGTGGVHTPGTAATAGSANTGGGGGGGNGNNEQNGAAGGKGVVILAFPLANFSNTTTGSPTESDDGTTKVLIFNGDGSYTT